MTDETTLTDRYGAGVERAGVRHTPGPWLAASRPSSVVGLPVVAQTGRSIASVTYFGLGEHFRDHNDECLANARLIAAAPDLLAAVATTRALISEAAATGFRWEDGDWADRLFANQRVLSAALAKATLPTPGGSDE